MKKLKNNYLKIIIVYSQDRKDKNDLPKKRLRKKSYFY